MHIAIAGNIGSGKTTLTALLAKNYAWNSHFEDTQDNPYLEDFYENMKRWSFNLQIYFLNTRFNQIMSIRKSNLDVIQDRTIYEDARIFASNLYEMDLMSKRDYYNYSELFDSMTAFLQPPDLLIYLKASLPTLVSQIQKRGREYEKGIRLDYLKRLNEKYDEWVASYSLGKILVINTDNLDFVNETSALNTIIDRVDAELHGLF